MEKPTRFKLKNKKPAPKPKSAKKRKSEGPSCSLFLAELSRKLASKKKKEEESPKNIVQTIIESIANALPVIFSRKPAQKKESPVQIETLQIFAPELIPNDTVDIKSTLEDLEIVEQIQEKETFINKPTVFKMPRMPIVNSELIKANADRRRKAVTQDASVNTGNDHNVASEIAKHVGTLKKISLIAEEFNQKTAKNLKEIVDSVQEDLIKKLEEIEAEQKRAQSPQIHDEK